MKFTSIIATSFLFILLIVLFVVCSGCAHVTPEPKAEPTCGCNFGPCAMPPAEHDGFLLIACKVEGITSISCLYIGLSETKQRCAIIVRTTDCENYEIVESQCETTTKRGEQIKWL